MKGNQTQLLGGIFSELPTKARQSVFGLVVALCALPALAQSDLPDFNSSSLPIFSGMLKNPIQDIQITVEGYKLPNDLIVTLPGQNEVKHDTYIRVQGAELPLAGFEIPNYSIVTIQGRKDILSRRKAPDWQLPDWQFQLSEPHIVSALSKAGVSTENKPVDEFFDKYVKGLNKYEVRTEKDVLGFKLLQGIYGFEPSWAGVSVEKPQKKPDVCPEHLRNMLICGPKAGPIPWGPVPDKKSLLQTAPRVVASSSLLHLSSNFGQHVAVETKNLNKVNGAHRHHWNTFATTVGIAKANGTMFCSGVLVSARHILTAAHCLCSNRTPSQAFFGDSDAPPDDKTMRFSLPIDATSNWRNPEFCEQRRALLQGQSESYPIGDLTLLRLAAPLPVRARPLLLPVEAPWQDEPHAIARVAGFGFSRKANATGEKNYANIELLADGCENPENKCRTRTEIVARPPEGKGSGDSCSGDSGGPLFVVHRGRHYLAGIVSRGLPKNPKGLCGKGGIYTDLRNSKTREWLRDAMK